MSAFALTLPDAARMMRESVKDKSYRAFPLGQEAGHYLRFKRKRLTAKSYIDYESGLDKFARFFADLELVDFEPPVGTERIEEFLDAQWGDRAPRTYNKNLSILRDFFRFQLLRSKLHGDPTLAIERAKKRGVYRTTFTPSQRRAILAESPELRDKLALRLLLHYGLRKGALQRVQFKHFDHNRRRLTVFTKGETVQNVRIPHASFWLDLERLILDTEAHADHYLLPRQLTRPVRFDAKTRKAVEFTVQRFHDKPMGDHGLHSWWYRALARAGVVESGVERGEKMHKARHTAGQQVLDRTGNVKAVQELLGHADPKTTMETYVEWDEGQLAQSLLDAIPEDEL